jgi:hypothetical protein
MLSNEKRFVRYVSAKTIYTAIPLYSSILCALPRVCRRNLWVRLLLFHFLFFIFSIFQYNIPTTIDVAYLSFYQNIFIWDLVLQDLLKGIQWCNQNLIWFKFFGENSGSSQLIKKTSIQGRGYLFLTVTALSGR